MTSEHLIINQAIMRLQRQEPNRTTTKAWYLLERIHHRIDRAREQRLIDMGYDLDDLDESNPYHQWMNDYDEEDDS